MASTPDIAWRRSTRCSGGQCVEVAKVGDQVLLRDSKNPQQTPLTFSADGWDAFTLGLSAGEFDR